MWGPRGRNDLAVMAQMGANAVRLYGNNPTKDHDAFLDAAEKHGMKVIPGFSEYPYKGPGYAGPPADQDCMHTGYNCYE